MKQLVFEYSYIANKYICLYLNANNFTENKKYEKNPYF